MKVRKVLRKARQEAKSGVVINNAASKKKGHGQLFLKENRLKWRDISVKNL